MVSCCWPANKLEGAALCDLCHMLPHRARRLAIGLNTSINYNCHKGFRSVTQAWYKEACLVFNLLFNNSPLTVEHRALPLTIGHKWALDLAGMFLRVRHRPNFAPCCQDYSHARTHTHARMGAHTHVHTQSHTHERLRGSSPHQHPSKIHSMHEIMDDSCVRALIAS